MSPKTTPPDRARNRAAWRDLYNSLGMESLEGFDQERMLANIRRERARHAGEPWVPVLDVWAEGLAGQLAEDVPGFDRAHAVRVLLELSSLLVALATADVGGRAIVNLIGFIADDLDREAGRG
jgi:hypothetical protein